MCLFNKHPFQADETPDSTLEGGTDGCVRHIPDLKGLVQWWGGQAQRGTRPPELGLATVKVQRK